MNKWDHQNKIFNDNNSCIYLIYFIGEENNFSILII